MSLAILLFFLFMLALLILPVYVVKMVIDWKKEWMESMPDDEEDEDGDESFVNVDEKGIRRVKPMMMKY